MMPFQLAASCALVLALSGAAAADDTVTPASPPPEFPGWQGMRVIKQAGSPGRMTARDLDGDGRDELILVNLRNARLDIYAWQGQPQDPTRADPPNPSAATDNINELPMAPEVKLTEVAVQQPPIDVLAQDLDGDGRCELYVLVSDPNRVVQLTANDENKWQKARQWNLQDGRYTGNDDLMKWLPTPATGSAPAPGSESGPAPGSGGSATLLVSCAEGIQQLKLTADAENSTRDERAVWLESRESIDRADWWLADLDHDGRDDLVEWTTTANRAIRWYKRGDEGFLPAQTLHDRAVDTVALLNQNDAADELLVLESTPSGVARRYRLSLGEESALGKQSPLTLPGAGAGAGSDGGVWTITPIEGKPTLLAVDPAQPSILRFDFVDDGWRSGDSYPSIAKAKAIVALPSSDNDSATLLLWPDAGGDLYRTTWDDGRLTYPQPLNLGEDAADRLILGLGRVGDTVWAVQKVGDDLRLHRWSSAAVDAETTHFRGVGGKADQAVWLGDAGLLVLDKFARGLRVVKPGVPQASAQGESPTEQTKAVSTEPPHVTKARLEEFRLFAMPDGTTRIGRLTEGVLQWLDADLHAVDQVMLPDRQRIADLALLPDGGAYALAQGGGMIHRLEPDDAGLLRSVETTRIDDGRAIHHDALLGLLLVTGHGVTRLAPGQPTQLEVVQSIDARTGRDGGSREDTINRVMTLDLDGDGRDEALLADDTDHQLTALSRDGEGELMPVMSWPVFEDQTYPYGDAGDRAVREPRLVRSLDLDGDGHHDLALLSHDRLVIYLAKEPQ